jgi:poly-gamma-glutamate synthesis protein (capsule biosynthesis protein)
MISLRIKALLVALILLFLPAALSEDMPEVEDVKLPVAHIRAAGDLMMHDKQLAIARQSGDTYDFHPQYSLAADSLTAADYTMANLETTVGMYNGQAYSGFPRFNAPESLLEAVKDSGVDFLTLANNHMLDRYFDGLKQTVDLVEEYGFDHGGAYRTREEYGAPVVVDVNGIKIGVLCYTAHANDMEKWCDPEAMIYGLRYLYTADFAMDVQAARDAGAEFIIAMPHWGTEYMRYPDQIVRDTAKEMIAAGVDLILGSHPHMVQPIEYVTVSTDAGERTGLVAWSLGNFVDDMKIQYTDSGIILDFTLTRQNDGTISLTDVGYVPIYCWKHDSMIRALPSGEYLEEKPEGMSDSTWSRMKASYDELLRLIGDDFAVLVK